MEWVCELSPAMPDASRILCQRIQLPSAQISMLLIDTSKVKVVCYTAVDNICACFLEFVFHHWFLSDNRSIKDVAHPTHGHPLFISQRCLKRTQREVSEIKLVT